MKRVEKTRERAGPVERGEPGMRVQREMMASSAKSRIQMAKGETDLPAIGGRRAATAAHLKLKGASKCQGFCGYCLYGACLVYVYAYLFSRDPLSLARHRQGLAPPQAWRRGRAGPRGAGRGGET